MARSIEDRNLGITIYVADGAVAGRVLHFTETGLVARVDRDVPRDERLRFMLRLNDATLSGEVESLGQDDHVCRLRFAALTDRDWSRITPYLDTGA